MGGNMVEIEKKSKFNEFIKIFVIFMIGSVLGYIVEMIVGLVQNGHFVSRQGLIYGPFTPVYGIGILVYYLFFSIVNARNKGYIFISAMILGGITEYLCSYIQYYQYFSLQILLIHYHLFLQYNLYNLNYLHILMK